MSVEGLHTRTTDVIVSVQIFHTTLKKMLLSVKPSDVIVAITPIPKGAERDVNFCALGRRSVVDSLRADHPASSPISLTSKAFAQRNPRPESYVSKDLKHMSR